MPEWVGHIIGKVRIEKYLARGGMAEVYLGTHLTLERQVAVKVLHSHIEAEPELLGRFQREAKVIASLRHPNIVQILDFDTHEGHPYIVMEYINGLSFSAYLRNLHEKNQSLSYKQVAHLLKSIASALDYAHAQGVVHRDIKPANILLHSNNGDFVVDRPITQSIAPVISDFGLVRIANSSSQTQSGMVSGTPKYMSPEQARGDKVDHRTDIYSLGVILYELLAGRVPFEADSTLTVIYKHINEPPPPIDGLSPQLQDLVNRVLAKDPNQRPQSAGELAKSFFEAIGMHAESETISTPPSRTLKPASVSRKQNPARGPLLIAAGVFACACLGVALLGVLGVSLASILPRSASTQVAAQPTMEMNEAPTSTDLTNIEPATVIEGNPVGVLRFQNGAALMDKVTISAALDLPPENSQYEAWLVDDEGEASRSIGVLERNDQAEYTLTYIDAQALNLLGQYNRLEITIEPSPDDNPNSSRQVAYSAYLPMAALNHVRHLTFSTVETPNEVPVVVGLTDNVTLIQQAAQAMSAAYEAGDRASARANAETIVNLIVGREDVTYYNDWDGDGVVNDPGDGYGLLINGDQAGYLDGMIHHSSYAADAKNATGAMQVHAGHVEMCIQNLESWAPELRDRALNIAKASENQDISAEIRQAAALADQIVKGVDINGSESIDPIPGEGGVRTAIEHAGYMSDMQIFPGENREP